MRHSACYNVSSAALADLTFCEGDESSQQINVTSYQTSVWISNSLSTDNRACGIVISNLPDITLIELYSNASERFTMTDPDGSAVRAGRYLHATGSDLSQYQTVYRRNSLHLLLIQTDSQFTVRMRSKYDLSNLTLIIYVCMTGYFIMMIILLVAIVTAAHSLRLQEGYNSVPQVDTSIYSTGFILSHPTYSLPNVDEYKSKSTYSLILTDVYKGQSLKAVIKRIDLLTSSSQSPEIDTRCQWNSSLARTADQLTIAGGNSQLRCTGVKQVTGVRYTLTPDGSGHLTFTLTTRDTSRGFVLQFTG